MLENLIGKQAIIERLPTDPTEMQANWADVQKAGQLLGWEPQVGLQEGVSILVDWYRKERSWASQIITA
jgi:UDP-glucuronate 4-epimerase